MEDTVGRWRKSSYSGNGGSSCVETASTDRSVMVRDSKLDDSPVITISADGWRRFTERLKTS
jgi:hypothetical protein